MLYLVYMYQYSLRRRTPWRALKLARSLNKQRGHFRFIACRAWTYHTCYSLLHRDTHHAAPLPPRACAEQSAGQTYRATLAPPHNSIAFGRLDGRMHFIAAHIALAWQLLSAAPPLPHRKTVAGRRVPRAPLRDACRAPPRGCAHAACHASAYHRQNGALLSLYVLSHLVYSAL